MSLSYPESVEVVEVSPRDGLQALGRTISTDDKLTLIGLLADAGFRTIEVTSLVRPDAVPELADADELLARLPRREGVAYRVLIANRRGAERAVTAGVDEAMAVVCCSEQYSLRNQGMTVEQALAEALAGHPILDGAGVGLTVGLGLAFFCPYEGTMPMHRPLALVDALMAAGVRRMYLSTSAGMADPGHVHRLCTAVRARHPGIALGLHLHDIDGTALACALAGMDAGVEWLEGSICGLGGGVAMPPSLMDIGNVASEDLVAMLEGMGIDTGVDLDALRRAGCAVEELLGIRSRGRFLRVGTRQDVLREAAQY
ncbi:hydroxymethylglutaryl-CoA lyase [Baekduia soli]|uniref:Hydroxymethylglutaryl-CoA lyase n=1 Tax=Baekduia soli TaxID=496014 RepID=A0A5B8U5R6_9ACTN|nr:hydroxymethylglutaryl-CoA lyase [Baekduia soli]QEC48434.1 hydroxymethylglutaryl-CoA lyase [Baekduia soli]